jgi:CRP-like cAMP-binding protein
MSNTNQNPLISFFKKFENLSEELILEISQKVKRMDLPKKTILLRKGHICDNLYFIEKGLARNYFIEDDKELTDDIIIDGELLVAFNSFVSRKPSNEQIELLEDSILYAIHYQDLQELYRQYPIMDRVGRLVAEHHYMSLASQAYLLKFSNSETRYRRLVERKPTIILRAPIGIIASYLGMKIETLSRIRSK